MKAQATLAERKRLPTTLLAGAVQHAAVRPVADHATPGGARDGTRALDSGHDFSQVPARTESAACTVTPTRCPFGGACHACPLPVQAKLAINQPGDKYEQEADLVAEEAVGAQRVQLHRRTAGPVGLTSVPPIVHEVLRSPGLPLGAAARAFMEPRLGARPRIKAAQPTSATNKLATAPHVDRYEQDAEPTTQQAMQSPFVRPDFDLKRVRIHTDNKAATSAVAINARAYTVGDHIVFASGAYSLGTRAGQRLLAHELTHVTQQRGAVQPRVQRSPAPEGGRPKTTSTPTSPTSAKPTTKLSRPESKLAWKWKDMAVYPFLVDIWNDLIKQKLTDKERKELKLTGHEAAAFYNWASAVGLALGGLGGAKLEGEEAGKDLGTVAAYAEVLQGVTPGSDVILDPLSRLLGLRFDKYLESDLFMLRLKSRLASVVTLSAFALGVTSAIVEAQEPSEGKGELTEVWWSKHAVLVRWAMNKILKERLKAPDFFDVGPLQLKTHPAFSEAPYAGGAVPSGIAAEGKEGVGESGEELKFGLTLNLPRMLGNKEATDLEVYRGWQTSVWFNYELKDPTETMRQAGKLPGSKLKGGTIFGGKGHLGLLEAGARYGGTAGDQLTMWFVRGGYGYVGGKDSTLKRIGFKATYTDWKAADLYAPGRAAGTPTAGQAARFTPFTKLHFGGTGRHQFDAGAALSFVSGSQERFGLSGFRGDFAYTYMGDRGKDKLPVFKLELSGSLNRLDWWNPNSPLMWGVLAKGTVGRAFGGVQVMSGAGNIPAPREQLFGEPLKARVPTAVIFSAGYAF